MLLSVYVKHVIKYSGLLMRKIYMKIQLSIRAR